MNLEVRKILTDVTQIDEPVHRPQKVILWFVIFQRELVEQRRLRLLSWPQLYHSSRLLEELNYQLAPRSSRGFSTEIAQCASGRRE